ncbi:thiazole biosynthesis protein, partial [Escherichia coli]
IKNAKIKNIDEVLDDVCEVGTLEVVNVVGENEIVVDIRQSNDILEASCEVLKIPFYDLKKEFKKLDNSKTYLLYCDKGVLSQLHGQYLK